VDEVANLAHVGHDDRQAACHGLTDGYRQALIARGQDEYPGAYVDILDVRLEAEKVHCVLDPQTDREATQVVLQRSSSPDGRSQAGSIPPQQGHYLKEVLDSLTRDELGNGHQVVIPLRVGSRKKPVLVDARRDGDHSVRRHPATDEKAAGVLSHGRHHGARADETDEETLEPRKRAGEAPEHRVVGFPAAAFDLDRSANHVEKALAPGHLSHDQRVESVRNQVVAHHPVRALAQGEPEADPELGPRAPEELDQEWRGDDRGQLSQRRRHHVGHERHRLDLLQGDDRSQVRPQLVLVERDGDQQPKSLDCGCSLSRGRLAVGGDGSASTIVDGPSCPHVSGRVSVSLR